MKLVVLALFVCSLPRPAAADCGCATAVVGTSPLVIADSCGKTPPKTTLVDDSGVRHVLHVVATHKGYHSSQFVLEPAGAGTLEITDGFGTTRTRIDPEKTSAWTADPVVGEQREIELGCGPTQSVKVATSATSRLAFVELTEHDHTQTGFVRVTGGELSLGHDMCSGPFVLANGRSYRAAITIGGATKTVVFTYSPS